ncbi:metallophosphoesterase family protein [Desulfogranum mediterraneum]|uniref:metallophosphoesterase family protein n=1 Tax=Desulfogranum mediterraneum TaxID=160661 RepID=UPI00041ECBE2|nr:YfcE family phosphodiesterase [Desulfogranum mediterraneum]
MTIRAGILSDTHLSRPDSRFIRQTKACFQDCAIIIHAGDLTESAVLEVFSDKTVYAVHGNMCSPAVRQGLPRSRTFALGDFTIGLTHGAGLGHDIESSLWDLFPEVDCMIYGHTHRPVCHRIGGSLIINPGSFQATGRYGAQGTYAILSAGPTLEAAIHTLPGSP